MAVCLAMLGLLAIDDRAFADGWNSIAGGDATAGHKLVEENCARCHGSDETGLLTGGSTPSQQDLAEIVTNRQILVRAFYFDRHPSMPRFLFGDYEMNNILAYFAELRTGNAQQPFPRSWTR
ncbi:MAG: c-type cytochrome [Pseudomonadota bacterium]